MMHPGLHFPEFLFPIHHLVSSSQEFQASARTKNFRLDKEMGREWITRMPLPRSDSLTIDTRWHCVSGPEREDQLRNGPTGAGSH